MVTPVPDYVPGRLLPEMHTSAKVAVITGDRDRVAVFAKALGEEHNMWCFRELEVREVEVDGEPVLFASHGMGGPGTALLVEELADSGVRSIVRVGSCGPLQPALHRGEVVLSAGAVRDDGTSNQYLPAEVPLVADADLLAALRTRLSGAGVRHTVGLTHCKDAYYAQAPGRMGSRESWHDRWLWLRRIGVLATDGETGALLAVATVRRVRAASALVVGGAAKDTARATMISCAEAAARGGLATVAADVRDATRTGDR